MGRKILAETLNGRSILALGGEDHLALIEVHKQTDVIMPAALGGLIHTHSHGNRHVQLLSGVLHIVMQQPPEAGVVFPDELSHVENRHLLGHDDYIGLKEKCESASRPRPRYRHQPRTTSRAVAAGHSSRNEGLMLEKIQMPPALLLGVIGPAVRLAADRAGKMAAFGKIDPDGQLALY